MRDLATILRLPIADIAIADRVGFYHPDHAANLGLDMAENGQSDPIHVRQNGNRAAQPWTLVAGLHRLRGAGLAGWSKIDAIQVADASSDDATLLRLELSENLDHRQPRPIERAMFIVARARLEEGVDHPGMTGERSQERANRMRRQKLNAETAQNQLDATGANLAPVTPWRARTCAAMQCSERALKRYFQLHRSIIEPFPAIAEKLDRHPLGDNMSGLLRIATLPTPDARQRVIEIILADPDMTSIDAALVKAELAASKAGGLEPIEQNRFARNVWSNFGRLALQQKRTFVRELPAKLTPGLRAELAHVLREFDD